MALAARLQLEYTLGTSIEVSGLQVRVKPVLCACALYEHATKSQAVGHNEVYPEVP